MLCGGAWIATAMLKQPFSSAFSENKVLNIEFSEKSTVLYMYSRYTRVFY